jgi:hypothetical protein
MGSDGDHRLGARHGRHLPVCVIGRGIGCHEIWARVADARLIDHLSQPAGRHAECRDAAAIIGYFGRLTLGASTPRCDMPAFLIDHAGFVGHNRLAERNPLVGLTSAR